MSKRRTLLTVLAFWLLSAPVAADVLVLVHGYASDAGTWETSGVTRELYEAGWIPAGPNGGPIEAARKSYSVNLPSEAPLMVQTNLLGAYLQRLRQYYPNEKLILVGHSAGGVVARLAVLGGNPFHVDEVVSIASPHLGTERAAQGLDIVDERPFFCPGPGIEFLKSVIGGNRYDYLKYSRGVLIDLLPSGSGNILSWANVQPHPDIRYVAIVRRTPYALGDWVVPVVSQDMNNVPALQGHVKVVYTDADHFLNPGDGRLLARLLAN